MRNFKELEIWKLGMEIAKAVYRLSARLPKEERYGLISQITRAGVSIPSNIAEGSAKSSEREFKHYLETALGSAFELETQLLIISELNMSKSNCDDLINEIQKEQRMIGSFISSVKNRLPSTKHPKPNTQNQAPKTKNLKPKS
jgi:four helix bundle protein